MMSSDFWSAPGREGKCSTRGSQRSVRKREFIYFIRLFERVFYFIGESPHPIRSPLKERNSPAKITRVRTNKKILFITVYLIGLLPDSHVHQEPV